ncbi:hypothetical protein GW17_00022136 [Ensete ventricosum]|nr:hypothetical protein GW17_00022136 [Ensete ventricosum]
MHNVREWLIGRTVEAFGSSDVTSHKQCWGFGVVTEESGRPGPCRVYKLVQVSQGRGLPVQIGSASREFAPLVGSFGLRLARAREKMPLLVSPGGDFILTKWRVNRTLGLTSVNTPVKLPCTMSRRRGMMRKCSAPDDINDTWWRFD